MRGSTTAHRQKRGGGLGGFILVGGQSRRMGRNKALLRAGGRSLLERTIELLRPHVEEVTLLGPSKEYARFGLRVVPDRWPRGGPLGGLCTGLVVSAYDWNIFLACDLPLLEGRFLELLRERARKTRKWAVVPRTKRGWEPLAAAYDRRCLPVLRRTLASRKGGVVDALGSLPVDAIESHEVEARGLSSALFLNVNRPEDWKRAKHALTTALR